MTWLFFDLILHLKDKNLVMRPKQNSLPISEITGLVLNTPRSGLGHMKDWLNTVMLWLSDYDTNNLQK